MEYETIYVDSDGHCHRIDDGTMTALETDFFYGKCDAFVEGHYCEIYENGFAIYPWKPSSALDAVQREYERQLLKELQENSIPVADLENAYREGVDSVYD